MFVFEKNISHVMLCFSKLQKEFVDVLDGIFSSLTGKVFCITEIITELFLNNEWGFKLCMTQFDSEIISHIFVCP